jgi:UDP-N-acetylmuramyl pentapeptide phosphotransferase/UDP-N-acetylglucosamine-1-phosphate transferase
VAGFLTWLLVLAVGFLAVRFLRLAGSGLLASPVLARENYRGVVLPTAGGLLVVLGVVGVESGRAALGALGLGDVTGLTTERSLVLLAVVAFGLLGLVDDVLAQGEERGYRGHLRALASGRLTTGFVKLAGGAAVAVLLVASPGFRTGARLVVDALLIALGANLANLFDRAPARTLKVASVAYLPLAVALGAGGAGIAVALPMGCALGLFGDDAREQLMLGDTGANVVGAVLALGVVLGTAFPTRVAVVVAVAVLNLAAEVVSFSRVIASVPALRWADTLGRRSG